ncbi:hypothetical protein E4T56_gene15847 [Termitomyces sp. T112]|nr:hypothetical protein E4T56_gene15847 [Termitomyces sp. T112]
MNHRVDEVDNAFDPQTQQRAKLPSDNTPAPATRSDTLPQQASTSPGDGSEVHANINQVPFKERVIGVAKITRGTVLRKPDLKQEGEAILEGQTTQEDLKNA